MKIEFENGSVIETIDSQEVVRGQRATFIKFNDSTSEWGEVEFRWYKGEKWENYYRANLDSQEV